MRPLMPEPASTVCFRCNRLEPARAKNMKALVMQQPGSVSVETVPDSTPPGPETLCCGFCPRRLVRQRSQFVPRTESAGFLSEHSRT